MQSITRQSIRNLVTEGVLPVHTAVRLDKGITASEKDIDELYDNLGPKETTELIDGAMNLFIFANRDPISSGHHPSNIVEAAKSSNLNIALQHSHNKTIATFTSGSESLGSGAPIVETPDLSQTNARQYQDHLVSHSNFASYSCMQNSLPSESELPNPHRLPTDGLQHSYSLMIEETEGSNTISDPGTISAPRSQSPPSQSPPLSSKLRESPASDDTIYLSSENRD